MYKNFIAFFFFCFGFIAVYSQTSENSLPLNGKYKLYYKDGTLMEKGHYKNSKKTGLWYFYNDSGLLLKKEKYQDDQLLWQIFFEKGKITKIIDKNGKITERPKCGC